MTDLAGSRPEFIASRALELAKHAAGVPLTRWTTGMGLSARFGWFADDDRLAVVATPHESQSDVDLGLAYGLGHLVDRELLLVLPRGTEGPTCRRLPWIDAPVQVFTFDADDKAQWVPPLTKGEVLAGYDDDLVTSIHSLGDRAESVAQLVAWADSCPELVPTHRPSYRAWQCRGRMVLRLTRKGTGVEVVAGVPSATTPSPAWVTVADAPLAPEELHRAVSAVSAAIADRFEGLDSSHGEHQLQERLAGSKRKLGMVDTLREFPATRPGGGRGYIDLLGVGADDALHIVETKIGSDPMLVLQGLDYWIWVTAHRQEIVDYLANDLGTTIDPATPVWIDYVIGAKGNDRLSPYSAAQLEVMDGSIPWRVHWVDGWDEAHMEIESLGRRESPGLPRAAEPRYAVRLGEDLVERSVGTLGDGPFFRSVDDGVVAAARPALAELRAQGALHRFAHHVRSSQTFAVNLFGAMSSEEQRGVWSLLGHDVVECQDVTLEYVDPLDALQEAQPKSPHQTQVDVVMRAMDASGRRLVALIEVKLSESGFGGCSAFTAATNTTRHVCHQDGPWGGEPGQCHQLSNKSGPHRRTYDLFVTSESVVGTGRGCEFRELNQPLRNVALGRALLDRNEADAVVFALCAPEANRHVWRQWRRVEEAYAYVAGVEICRLVPGDLLEALGADRRRDVTDHYGPDVMATATDAAHRTGGR